MSAETKTVDVLRELDFCASLYREGTTSHVRAMEARAVVAELIERANVLAQVRTAFLCGKVEYSADWLNFKTALARIGGAA